jgi:putative DNA primase/helicase
VLGSVIEAMGLTDPPEVVPLPPPVAEPPPPPPRFKLLSVAELHAMPRMRWLIYSVLPEKGIAAVYGPSTSGKSFLTIDMVAAVAEQRDWFGYRIKKQDAQIVMVVLEAESGFRLRVEAWEAANERPFPSSVRFVFGAFRLNDRSDVLALAAAVDTSGGADLIVIDTLNKATPGADENSSRDMGVILEGCGELQGCTGGLVLLVHHHGKDQTKGMRGHSSLFAALDAAIEVTRTDERRQWKSEKVKDGRDGQAHGFRLEIVDLGEDEDGELITSCVIRTDDAPVHCNRPRPPKGGNQKIVYDALQPLFRDAHQFGKAGAPPPRPCITLGAAIEGVRDRLTVEPKRRTERARQAITGLVASGVLRLNEDWLWLA